MTSLTPRWNPGLRILARSASCERKDCRARRAVSLAVAWTRGTWPSASVSPDSNISSQAESDSDVVSLRV
jgi:hypothetical protein